MIRYCVAAFLCAPTLLSAQDPARFYPPVGCTEVLTIQMRGCEVDHIYTCSNDNPGESWRVNFRVDGPIFISKIDAETQWLESYDLFPTSRDVLIQPATDPASLSELLSTGTDTYDFTQRGPDGITRVVGFDTLTGEEVVIDGEPLLRTEFSARFEGVSGPYMTLRGNEYVSRKHGRFISGSYARTVDGQTDEWDNSPVDFIYPGEPGFFEKKPLYDCDVSLTRFVPRLEGSDQ